MSNYLEIKWHGRAGQGVVTASTVLAEVLAAEGKYVQALPGFDVEKRPPSVKAYNRLSETPVKLHSYVKNADIVAVMDPPSVLNSEIGSNANPDAVYIVNTSHTPEYVREKLAAPAGNIFTVDAGKIALEEIGEAIPNIPMMTVIIKTIDWIPMEQFKRKLGQSLSSQLGDNPDLVAANLKTVDRAINEVKELETGEPNPEN